MRCSLTCGLLAFSITTAALAEGEPKQGALAAHEFLGKGDHAKALELFRLAWHRSQTAADGAALTLGLVSCLAYLPAKQRPQNLNAFYELALQQLTAPDESGLRAQVLLASSELFSKELPEEALKRLRQSLDLWAGLKNAERTAAVRAEIAITTFTQARDQREGYRLAREAVAALEGIANPLCRRRPKLQRKDASDALQAWQKSEARTWIDCCTLAGLDYQNDRNYAAMIGAYVRGIELADEFEYETGLRNVCNLLAAAAGGDSALELQRGLRFYALALEVARTSKSDLVYGHLYYCLGMVYRQAACYDQALAALDRAVERLKRSGHQDRVGIAVHERGLVYYDMEEYQRAIEACREAMAYTKGTARERYANLIGSLGLAYLRAGDHTHAADCFQWAIDVVTDHGPKGMSFSPNVLPLVALSASNQAEAYSAAGDRERAIDLLGDAANIYAAAESPKSQSNTLLKLADLEAEAGKEEAASQHTRRALAVLAKIEEPDENVHLAMARGLRQLGRKAEALEEFARGIKTYEERLTRITTPSTSAEGSGSKAQAPGPVAPEFLAKAFESAGGPYRGAAQLAVELGRPAQAFQYLEASKGQALRYLLAYQSVPVETLMSSEERTRDGELRKAITTLSAQLRQTEGADERRRIEEQRRQAEFELANFHIAVYEAHAKEPARRGEIPIVDEGKLSQILPSDTAVLEYLLGEKGGIVLIGTKGAEGARITPRQLPTTAEEIRSQVSQLRDLLRARRTEKANKALGALYTKLIKPAKDLIQERSRLLVVPDGPLFDLPFQALAEGSSPLIEKHEIVIAPSASLLAACRAARSEEPKPKPAHLVAFAVDTFGERTWHPATDRSQLGNLPAVAAEFSGLRDLFGQGFLGYRNQAAQESEVRAACGKGRWFHFATHAFLDSRSPLSSSLVLGQPPPNGVDDGFLEAREIATLSLGADMVVLSACETARGELSSGEGVLGLSWALLAARVPSLVVSQWKVADESTTALMLDFYKQLKRGRSKSAALREAQLTLRRTPRYADPFHWAPFVLVGDWR